MNCEPEPPRLAAAAACGSVIFCKDYMLIKFEMFEILVPPSLDQSSHSYIATDICDASQLVKLISPFTPDSAKSEINTVVVGNIEKQTAPQNVKKECSAQQPSSEWLQLKLLSIESKVRKHCIPLKVSHWESKG